VSLSKPRGDSRLAYISFDKVPAPKGAATHIAAFTQALARAFGAVELVTVSMEFSGNARTERWPGVFQTELPALGVSLIDRVMSFRRSLERWLHGRTFDVVQFRSIFEGMPLLRLQPRPRLIFEVNGLPSVELKYRYPRVADDRELMRKVVAQEQACLDAADCIVTPSGVTKQYLSGARGVDAAKIRLIPNGVNTRLFHPSAAPVDFRSEIPLLYFGTLTSWQGVDIGLRAAAKIPAAQLTIVGAGGARQMQRVAALARKLEAGSRVHVCPAVEQPELVRRLQRSFAALAPLAINDRNVKQGCCPLKILEAMATGVPAIASDLPVVRELGEHGRHLMLVKPNSVDQLAQAVLDLRADPGLWRRIAENGRARVVANYSWDRSGAALAEVCAELGMTRASSS
jgi:glycosyltransferase involved in cell wall biosynthesis